MPHITIIETGFVNPRYRERHGTYPQMFERMIAAADPSIACEVVSIPSGETLPDPAGLDAILITGSPAGVYDEFDWIAPLENFVRKAHDKRVPMVGVCFGHQLIAQALGGTVRKSEKGWGMGRHVYRLAPGNGLIEGDDIAIACSHQDQVITPPASARTIMSSTFTPHAGLLYANGTTLSVQPHPEFTVGYADALCDLHRDRAPEDVIATAKASLAEPLDHTRLGGVVTRFLTERRT
ncbi:MULTISPECIES: gamma-glutamyl-gamma-aminobutyrate hydrolase family protein [unclassified Bradyrhizobium]|uniref:type 1 glutamine amidotransferase n=1 Tax=unclassified Bradyrhizobium TaxID=2631580 RepID=UPI00247B0ECA|nr:MULTISPECIES: gamma-glutamyl-gamma-aminobutyrate hydrolase family protein [unclassified Bradyrhizobium]WGS19636.1 gamma-glutamyl-gamma-aminobutyrate hydrolase family protein [Bradyrhizobium sp. ISRA463]WGS26480.1 gamma-glutamyl-gamma-aminobutyrate hydrolase family protein [Bradyrhizobium sp. ISRA464]